MSREIIVSETDKIAVVLENGKVNEFFLSEGDQFVGDIIFATVESIVPAIEAAFLNIGREKSGFIHVSDLPSSRKQQSGIRQFLKPQQPLLVQVTREPTGNKGACLTGYIQLPGRYLVLTPFERRIGLSKRIYDARERARLARIARIICGSGYGIVLRPEAVGQSEQALRDDLKLLLGRWKSVLAQSEKQVPGTTLYRDQDILERILREGSTHAVSRIIVDNQETYERAAKYFEHWSDTRTREKLRIYKGDIPIMNYYGIFRQLEFAIQPLVQLPSGGTLVIQPTEALTSIDVNTSSMNSAESQPETILRTNVEAAEEAAKQLILRDIGGVVVIDFIDMDNPRDQQIVWTKLSEALQHDKSQPQISYFSEFGLVEMTRRRQRQRLSEMLTMDCPSCQGIGRIRNMMYRADILTGEGMKSRLPSFLSAPPAKETSYRAGVEKQNPKEQRKSRRQERGQDKNQGRNQGRNSRGQDRNKEREREQEREIENKAPLTVEVEATQSTPTRSAPPPSAPPQHSKKKEKSPEDPRDLLFDENYFTAEINNEFLDQFIEREDNLNVSSKLAGQLDKLIEQIDEDGLESLLSGPKSKEDKPNKKSRGRSKAEPKQIEEDTEVPVTEEIQDVEEAAQVEAEPETAQAEEANEPTETADKVEDASDENDQTEAETAEEAPVEEVVEKAPRKKAAKKAPAKKAATRKKVTKKAKETADTNTEAGEEPAEKAPRATKASKAKAKESAATRIEKAEERAAKAAEIIEASNEAENAPADVEKVDDSNADVSKATVSEPSKRTRRRVVKKLLTKRRSIRSFRPKK